MENWYGVVLPWLHDVVQQNCELTVESPLAFAKVAVGFTKVELKISPVCVKNKLSPFGSVYPTLKQSVCPSWIVYVVWFDAKTGAGLVGQVITIIWISNLETPINTPFLYSLISMATT